MDKDYDQPHEDWWCVRKPWEVQTIEVIITSHFFFINWYITVILMPWSYHLIMHHIHQELKLLRMSLFVYIITKIKKDIN